MEMKNNTKGARLTSLCATIVVISFTEVTSIHFWIPAVMFDHCAAGNLSREVESKLSTRLSRLRFWRCDRSDVAIRVDQGKKYTFTFSDTRETFCCVPGTTKHTSLLLLGD